VVLWELIQYTFQFHIKSVLCNITFILSWCTHIQNNDTTPE